MGAGRYLGGRLIQRTGRTPVGGALRIRNEISVRRRRTILLALVFQATRRRSLTLGLSLAPASPVFFHSCRDFLAFIRTHGFAPAPLTALRTGGNSAPRRALQIFE